MAFTVLANLFVANTKTSISLSCIKSIFVKAPSRRKKFKTTYPQLPLPPMPSTTRWSTWLKAAEYYNENFFEIKCLVESLSDEDNESIRIAKNLLASDTIVSDLAFIKSNFAVIHRSLEWWSLETKGLCLKNSLKEVKNVKKSLKQLDNRAFLNKFEAVFARNVGFKDIQVIEKLLFTSKKLSSEYVTKLTP
ncbi:PREDICTED: uncharacterized protein LOC108373642, partial [Rhagoletis zephyria]|uniref:uncharacterized protein LOC108373642 n=1 Tax=Rhagoletis zephyria TaxID=28612 RepID=UPI0008119D98